MMQLISVFSLVFVSILSINAASITFVDRRTRPPYFPSTPASCPICEKDYPNINSCAEAAPVLANFTMIMYNPGAFIDIIKCACGDTFKAAFPQCVDCFVQTGQDDVLNTKDLPAVVDGMRRICAIQSTLLGNVTGANSAPTPTPTSGIFITKEIKNLKTVVAHTTIGALALTVAMGLFGL